MKQIRYLIIALLCLMGQGAWAQTEVSSESELRDAVTTSNASIKLTADFKVSSHVSISKKVTIDLNNHTLSGNMTATTSTSDFTCIFVISSDGNLTLKNGTLSDSDNSATSATHHGAGGIVNKGTLTVDDVTFKNLKGSYGGAIRNKDGATLTFNSGTIDGCEADGGGIYNDEGATLYFKGGTIKNCTSEEHSGGAINNHGTCEISGGTIKDNSCKNNGGGIGNFDSGYLTISGGTIKGNDAKKHGDGVYIGSGTLYMEGNPYIKDNTDDNLYLNGSSMKINVGDPFTSGAAIGVSLSDYNRAFTSGFRLNNDQASPSDYFTADVSGVELEYENDEAYLNGDVCDYVERSWSGGNTDGEVVSSVKSYVGYTTLSSDDETLSGGWYLLSGEVNVSNRAKINGNVRFILEDGCNYTFKKGIYIMKGKTLTIYGQENDSGKLIVTDGDGQTAIGGNEDEVGGSLVIHGGYVKAHSNDNNFAGIGGGNHSSGMQSVTIYGGEVDAHGESSAAGIGGGQQNDTSNHPVVKIYGGKVTTDSEDYGAGIGGGEDRGGCEVYIWGGTITATGGSKAAGIGGGQEGGGNKFVMYGGTVTATGGKDGAGVGGGHKHTGGDIEIQGGKLIAEGKDGAYAIGSGDDASGNSMTLTLGSTVCVKDGNGNLVGKDSRKSTINSATSCTVMTCTHSGATISDKDDTYHHYNCSYCEGEDEAHTKGSDGKCTVCGREIGKYTWTFYESNTQGTAYQSSGTGYTVNEDSEFTFPDCNTLPDKMVFAGWEHKAEAPNSVTVSSSDGLYSAGETVTVEGGAGDRNYYARYMETTMSGSGTEGDPFTISSTDDLDNLISMIDGGNDFSGNYIALNADVTYDNSKENNFSPIGTSTTNFNGCFNGQGHTISGINISSSSGYKGLFGYIGESGVVKNLTLANSTITGGDNTGGLSGKNAGTIENCVIGSDVEVKTNSSNTNIGSFAGYSSGKVSGCVSKATVGSSKSKKSGGIVGYTTGSIEYCLYLGGNVNGSNYIGSIAGNKGTAATFTKSYYTPSDGQPNGVGSNNQNDDKDGAEAGYTVTCGSDGASLSFGSAETSFNNSGIKVYSDGLLYDGALYTGSDDQVTFNVSVSDDKTVSSVLTDNGTIVSNTDDSYTLTMASANAVITVETSDIATITLTNGEDNCETLEENDGNVVNVEYDRDLTADGSDEVSGARTRADGTDVGTAYSVCLPYDFDFDERAYTDSVFVNDFLLGLGDFEIADTRSALMPGEDYAVARVFTLVAVDKENKQFIFTDAPAFIPAGMSAVVVVYNGKINLGAKRVRINTMLPLPGQFVYPSYADYQSHGKNYLGYWKGSLETLRSFFEAIETEDLSLYTPMYQPANGDLQAFPAAKFADDFMTGTPSGIRSIDNGQLIMDNSWYDLLGRKLDKKPTEKGVYIHNNKKKVIK